MAASTQVTVSGIVSRARTSDSLRSSVMDAPSLCSVVRPRMIWAAPGLYARPAYNPGMSMTLKIVQAGDPVLRQTARALSEDEVRSQEVQRLVDLMRETMQ